jgi:AGCS family alanine or glycine:cation symporter
MSNFNVWVEAINAVLWSNTVLYTLLFTGIVFTIWSGFSQYYALTHGFKVIRGDYDKADDPGAITHFQALSAALSATVGLGNIGGVALAISLGGPGAVFWMWVVGFLGMGIKLTEVSLAMLHRDTSDPDNPNGGPMWVIDKNIEGKSKPIFFFGKLLGGVFCVALICSTITAGNLFQTWNVAELTESYFNVPGYVTGLILATLVGAVIIGGIKRIGAVASKLVPFMLILYILACLVVLSVNFDQIPAMLTLIVTSAFSSLESSNAFIGGTAGYAFMYGMQRALFSNEAGQGSSPVAHSAAKTDEPIREGIVAGLEPFIDTIVVCTMSALVILVTGIWNRPAELTVDQIEFTQLTENTWAVDTNDPKISVLEKGRSVFMIYQGKYNEETGNNLKKVFGSVTSNNANEVVVTWSEIKSDEKPMATDNGIYLDYVGATLTAAAFDKVIPGLGKWLVTLASWLFAISTMISWSYYGEKGIVYLIGQKGVLLYKIVFCILAVVGTLGFIKTDAELNMFANLGTGLCLIANLPIIWMFGHQAMKSYKDYIRRLKAGDFAPKQSQ